MEREGVLLYQGGLGLVKNGKKGGISWSFHHGRFSEFFYWLQSAGASVPEMDLKITGRRLATVYQSLYNEINSKGETENGDISDLNCGR